MALSREQSISKYGTEKYTAWGETEASADWAAKGSPTPTAGGASEVPGRFVGSIDPGQIPSTQEFIEKQFTGEDEMLQALIKRMGERERPTAIFTRLEEQAELPALRKVRGSLTGQVHELEDVLKGIVPSVKARTRESLVTEAQKRGIVTAEKRPLLERLGEIGTALSRIGGQITESERLVATKVGLEIQGQGYDLEPYQLLFATRVDRNARLASGFSQDKATKLDLLFDTLKRKRTLSDQDWEIANTLASEERTYLKNLQTAAAEAGASLEGNESAETLLGMIGRLAKEEIAFERRQAGRGTAGERATASERGRLEADVKAGATFKDVIQRYGAELSTSEIRSIYNANTRYDPAKESEEEVRQWTLKPEAEDVSSIRNVIIGMKAANEPLSSIEAYIYAKGKSPSDFNDILAGYKKKTWNPFD